MSMSLNMGNGNGSSPRTGNNAAAGGQYGAQGNNAGPKISGDRGMSGLQQGLPEERSLPAPPRKRGFLDLLLCRCG